LVYFGNPASDKSLEKLAPFLSIFSDKHTD
jgi:hypothetical protein